MVRIAVGMLWGGDQTPVLGFSGCFVIWIVSPAASIDQFLSHTVVSAGPHSGWPSRPKGASVLWNGAGAIFGAGVGDAKLLLWYVLRKRMLFALRYRGHKGEGKRVTEEARGRSWANVEVKRPRPTQQGHCSEKWERSGRTNGTVSSVLVTIQHSFDTHNTRLVYESF